MTVQLRNSIFPIGDEGFSIDKYTGNAPFDISKYFERPFISFSACWRGYVATFGVEEHILVLKDLRVFKHVEKPKIINGIAPKFIDFLGSEIPYYENVGLELEYSGRMLITKGYKKLGLRTMFNIAENENISELVFSSGILEEYEDLSYLIDQFRETLYDHVKEEFTNGNLLKLLKISPSITKKQEKEITEHLDVLISEEKLSELPELLVYPLFENFKLKDANFKRYFNQRFFLNYGHSAYDW